MTRTPGAQSTGALVCIGVSGVVFVFGLGFLVLSFAVGGAESVGMLLAGAGLMGAILGVVWLVFDVIERRTCRQREGEE
jgi:hypothetical protein